MVFPLWEFERRQVKLKFDQEEKIRGKMITQALLSRKTPTPDVWDRMKNYVKEKKAKQTAVEEAPAPLPPIVENIDDNRDFDELVSNLEPAKPNSPQAAQKNAFNANRSSHSITHESTSEQPNRSTTPMEEIVEEMPLQKVTSKPIQDRILQKVKMAKRKIVDEGLIPTPAITPKPSLASRTKSSSSLEKAIDFSLPPSMAARAGSSKSSLKPTITNKSAKINLAAASRSRSKA